jgi:hypothetical protein
MERELSFALNKLFNSTYCIIHSDNEERFLTVVVFFRIVG